MPHPAARLNELPAGLPGQENIIHAGAYEQCVKYIPA